MFGVAPFEALDPTDEILGEALDSTDEILGNKIHLLRGAVRQRVQQGARRLSIIRLSIIHISEPRVYGSAVAPSGI